MRHAREMLTAVVVIALAAGTCWAGSTAAEIKWSQPVVRDLMLPEFIIGWDEPSMVNIPIAADDFLCEDPRPVVDVHWWGSFPEIEPQGGIIPQQPDGFLITFWTDVPAGADPDMLWSHPKDPIHTVDVRNYICEPAGWDIDVYTWYMSGGEELIPVDEAFQYNATFDPGDYFDQEPGTIYWISIQAYFNNAEDANVWGWKTRPHYWNDDAVVHWGEYIPDPTGGPDKMLWEEIWGPDGQSWDLAYELSVPEPATMALLSVGGVAVLIRRRRKRHV